MGTRSNVFGKTKNDQTVRCFTMENKNGMKVKVLDYGAIIQSILMRDKNGTERDLVLGYDTIEAYEKGNCFLGAFVGRYANRIGNSSFELNGKTYHLPANEGKNHLHGNFASKVYNATIDDNSIIFDFVSPDGEEGYPGKLTVSMTYTLTDDNELILDYKAKTDKDTVINLTNHSYFNLNGHDGGDTAGHQLYLNASSFTEIKNDSIPTGKLIDVTGSPMDFRAAKLIGKDRDSDYQQLRIAGGYDHNFVLDSNDMGQPAARLYSPESGICMECFTTQPGIQLYNSNFLGDDAAKGMGKNGAIYEKYGAVCLETQHFPDSPNQPDFPSTVIHDSYHQTTCYRFSYMKKSGQ